MATMQSADVLSKREISTITQIVTLSEKKVDIDYYHFCYSLIRENRLTDPDTGLYSVEFYPKKKNYNHQILRYFPHGIPESRQKRDRKRKTKKPNGSFHNQCSFYCKLKDNHMVHVMVFAHPKLKIVGLKNDDRDYIEVAQRFIREFEYFFDQNHPRLENGVLTTEISFPYFNEMTGKIERHVWAPCDCKFEIYNQQCEMYNQSFHVKYRLDLDEMIDVLQTKYSFNARKKDNYSGVICSIPADKWQPKLAMVSPEIMERYDNNLRLNAKVHLLIFSTGNIIMIFKNRRDSNIIYDMVKDMFTKYRRDLISCC